MAPVFHPGSAQRKFVLAQRGLDPVSTVPRCWLWWFYSVVVCPAADLAGSATDSRWLTYRVMAFDALSEHARHPREQRTVFRRHRLPLLLMGVFVIWVQHPAQWALHRALFAAAFVILVLLAIWIYTLVFVFSSLAGFSSLTALWLWPCSQG
ncbi:MAG: hypothetical protein IPH35_18395 [Rhodoferax sp.]|nr:hypothetical protein [Rhodoferax sp.]